MRQTAEEVFDYVSRVLTAPMGVFYAAEDADSEGEEGKFYVWTKQEVIEILGEEEGEVFCKCFDVTEQGNFEGTNVLNQIHIVLPVIAEELGLSFKR